MIIAVSGANGHVGVNLCRELADRGHEVKALVHQHDSNLKNLNVKIFRGDLLQKESLKDFISGSEVVFHLAAKISIYGDRDGGVVKLNTEGTRNILDLSRKYGVRKFIHFSSIHAISQLPLNEKLDETRTLVGEKGFAYDRSKAAGEKLVLKAATEGFDAVVLAPTAIIGPADPEPGLMGQAYLQIYHGKIPALIPGGYNVVDVRDIVDAAINAIEKGKRGEKYLLSARWHSIGEMSGIISKVTGKNTVTTEMPFWVAKAGLPFITLYSRITRSKPLYTSESLHILENAHHSITNEKAIRDLNFNPRPVEETIADLFTWFKNNNYLKS